MANPSSQSIRSESEMVSELRPIMPFDLFMAAIEGNRDVLIPRLGLQPEEPMEIDQVLTEEKDFAKTSILNRPRQLNALSYPMVTIKASHFDIEDIEIRDNQTVQFELESATNFGETLLHLLITKKHNELALKVFQRDMSLLLAQNKMLETPLHSAAKVRNGDVICDLIESDPAVVLDALEKTNKNGETALQISAKYGDINVVRQVMGFGLRVSCKIINKMISPLYTAIVEGHTSMVQSMLQIEPTLAYAQFSNGMFPIHVAARMGNVDLVRHFMEEYPHCVELLDPHGRNLFHIAAEENQNDLFGKIFIGTNVREMMNNATDYEGNTPLHIAAMNGHRSIMRVIWENKKNNFAETVENNRGLTPFQLSASQMEKTMDIDLTMINKYKKTNGNTFTLKWFVEVMEPLPRFENIWETAQFIGLGSVLITTVTFAAAFTIPGGYNQDHGTPILGRKYAFRAFILANSFAFIQGFISLIIIIGSSGFSGQLRRGIIFAKVLFGYATNFMVMAFGLGSYVTLAPICLPMAILLLVISLFFASPAKLLIITTGKKYSLKLSFSNHRLHYYFGLFALCSVVIFCLAFL